MKLAALHHITVPGKGTYTPGEIMPDGLSDGQIRRLLRLRAVRVMEDGAEDAGKASPSFEAEPDDAEGTATGGTTDAGREGTLPAGSGTQAGEFESANANGGRMPGGEELKAEDDGAAADDEERPEPITIDAGESIVDVPAAKPKKGTRTHTAAKRKGEGAK